ncbi:tRNA(Ile2) 2-agmatinylcytidine synthetase TiaS [Pyrofollis japonicus]|uniref:TiaS agmantine-binding domain-containing protein n=1 Tax=Pyrofollis japonicus TaxID=3060460 RepID=UPI00295ABCE6|nr:DUF1743 domain-containing protein [Pyrofollis japonicus]BEP18153.1 tRNA(Ile2) 2-agmatinylcytidine synthetase TiaS [Pyrofollis japonicus]
MILAIGIDSFDTAFAGCTTHFSSILAYIISRNGYILADYPWLVRLNPAVPWKTRGNGAIALHIYVDGLNDAKDIIRILHDLGKAYNISPKASYVSILFSIDDMSQYLDEVRPKCLTQLYHRAVHEALPLDIAHECIRETRASSDGRILSITGDTNRGIIGATAALGMTLDDYTFELTVYRKIENWSKPRRIDPQSVVEFDIRTKPLTFMNYDYTINKPLIAPHGYDPVLYAVRGDDPLVLKKALEIIDPGEDPSHWILHRSNQATDAHLREKMVEDIHPYDNPLVTGILRKAYWISGGHLIGELCDNTGCISVAFYRETGWLRHFAYRAASRFKVTIGGQVKPHAGRVTLNAEIMILRECIDAYACSQRFPVTVKPPYHAFHHLMRPLERKHVMYTSSSIVFPRTNDDVLPERLQYS